MKLSGAGFPALLAFLAAFAFLNQASSEVTTSVGLPGGENGSVQFNVNRRFAGDSNIKYSTTTQKLTLGGQEVCLENGTDCPASVGGGGYAVEPATVTFRLDQGMTATNGTFTSSVTVRAAAGIGTTVLESTTTTTGLTIRTKALTPSSGATGSITIQPGGSGAGTRTAGSLVLNGADTGAGQMGSVTLSGGDANTSANGGQAIVEGGNGSSTGSGADVVIRSGASGVSAGTSGNVVLNVQDGVAADGSIAFQFAGSTAAQIIAGGILRVGDGDNTTPGLSFMNSTGNGIYRIGGSTFVFSASGLTKLELSTAGIKLASNGTQLDCSANTNGGKLTIGSDRLVACADDISGGGAGGGSSKWTDDGTNVYVTTITRRSIIGASANPAASQLFVAGSVVSTGPYTAQGSSITATYGIQGGTVTTTNSESYSVGTTTPSTCTVGTFFLSTDNNKWSYCFVTDQWVYVTNSNSENVMLGDLEVKGHGAFGNSSQVDRDIDNVTLAIRNHSESNGKHNIGLSVTDVWAPTLFPDTWSQALVDTFMLTSGTVNIPYATVFSGNWGSVSTSTVGDMSVFTAHEPNLYIGQFPGIGRAVNSYAFLGRDMCNANITNCYGLVTKGASRNVLEGNTVVGSSATFSTEKFRVVPSSMNTYGVFIGSVASGGYSVSVTTAGTMQVSGAGSTTTVTNNSLVTGAITGTSLALANQGLAVFADADNSNYIALKASAAIASSLIFTLPDADGSSGQALLTNGSQILSWGNPTASGDSLGSHVSTKTLTAGFGVVATTFTATSSATVTGAGGVLVTYGVNAATIAVTNNGNASVPSINLGSGVNGMFMYAANQPAFSVNGSTRAGFLSDGAFVVSGDTVTYGLTGGTSEGSIITKHNRFYRTANFANTSTIRLIGANNANYAVVGGEPANTPIILNGGSGHVRMDNASQLNWRNGGDSSDLRVVDMDSGNNVNIARDDSIGDIQVFNPVTIFDDAASPSAVFNVSAAGAIYSTSLTNSRWVKTNGANTLVTDTNVVSVGMKFNGNGSALTSGTSDFITIPYAGTITGWTVTSKSTGSIVVDVLACSGFNCNPTASIAGSELPTTSSTWAAQDNSLSTWTTAFTADTKFRFIINSITNHQDATIALRVNKD